MERDEAIELMHWTFAWLGELHLGPFAVDWFFNDAFTEAWNGLPPPPFSKPVFTHLFCRMAVLGLFSFHRRDRSQNKSVAVDLSYEQLLDAVSGVTSGPNRPSEIVATMTALGHSVYRECLATRTYFHHNPKQAARDLFKLQ